jgi:hypothetical protein
VWPGGSQLPAGFSHLSRRFLPGVFAPCQGYGRGLRHIPQTDLLVHAQGSMAIQTVEVVNQNEEKEIPQSAHLE